MTNIYENSFDFAKNLDREDPLKGCRSRFHIPKVNGKESIYFTGNSLGLQPKSVKEYINDELDGWATLGVEGHFHSNKRPWFHYHKFSKDALANIVGAKPAEVVSMNNLTTNLHLMLSSFYRPTKKRFKIMTEAGAFPSDQYAVESQIELNGFKYDDALVELYPRTNEYIIRSEDIYAAIEENAGSLALVLFGGVQYYSGQFFDLKSIVNRGHKAGALVGFDLAHAIGNIPMQLHDDNVDFAVWCSYKYLNSGPGGVSGIFVHEKHGNNPKIPRMAGWWGYNEQERFKMEKGFQPMPGADGWQLSNVNILSSAAHLASLDIFNEVSMPALRKKSIKLTGFLKYLIDQIEGITIITPSNIEERGCQLSLVLDKKGKVVFNELTKAGVLADWREPNVIRVAPVPLYNTFKEVFKFSEILKKAVAK